MNLAAPSEATTYPTTAAWWAATTDAAALVRVVLESKSDMGYLPGDVRRRIARLVANAFHERAIAAEGASSVHVRNVLGGAVAALSAWADGASTSEASRAGLVGALAEILTDAGAIEAGGPAWAEVARSVRYGLLATYDEANPAMHAELAVSGGSGITASAVRSHFPRPPRGVGDPS